LDQQVFFLRLILEKQTNKKSTTNLYCSLFLNKILKKLLTYRYPPLATLYKVSCCPILI